MKTFLANSYYADLLQLSSVLSRSVSNLRSITPARFLKEPAVQDTSLLFSVFHILQSHREEFPVYQNMFGYPAFCKEILQFAKECALYHIPADTLPASTPSQKELQKILAYVLALPLSEPTGTFMEEKKREDFFLTPLFPEDSYHYTIYQSLKSVYPFLESHPEKETTTLMQALNPRKEIEAIAQALVAHQEPSNIVLCDPASQIPIVQAVFSRYHIPYSLIHFRHPSRMHSLFTHLLKAGLLKDADSLFDCITSDAFPVFLDSQYFSVLESILTSCSEPEAITPYVQNTEGLQNYTRLYQDSDAHIHAWFVALQPVLDALYATETADQKIRTVFEILKKHPYVQKQEYLKEMLSLRKTLQEALPHIHSEQDAFFLLEHLQSLSLSSDTLTTDQVVVTDLRHPVPYRTHTYVAGCCSSAYPGFTPKSGLFDEAYVKKIPQYPSLTLRYTQYMESSEWITHSCRHLHYSCFTNDYEGREVQLAYTLKDRFSEIHCTLDRLRPYRAPAPVLSSSEAQALYLHEHTITGSISTIERWFQCPYSWFLLAGLKLNKKELPSLDASLTGTLQHAVLEQAVNTLKKDYASLSSQDIHSLLSPTFDSLKHVLPGQSILFTLSELRMEQGLEKALDFLKDMEAHTSYVPLQTEHRFLQPISEHVILRGIIDRIDTFHNQSLRIVDYKSSTHVLQASKVEQGLQLQLLSYLILACEMTKLTPSGAYYYSLKEEAFELPGARKQGRGKNTEVLFQNPEEETLKEEKKKAQMLRGWTFTDHITELDDDGTHIASLKKTQNFEEWKNNLTQVYEYFYAHVSEGDIGIRPVESACTFCDYASVCRFHGEYRTPASIVNKKEEN